MGWFRVQTWLCPSGQLLPAGDVEHAPVDSSGPATRTASPDAIARITQLLKVSSCRIASRTIIGMRLG